MTTVTRPIPGSVEQRTAHDAPELDGRRLHGIVPYGVESRELPGGFREIIEPGALAGAKLDDLVATVDHIGIPIGRYPGTLELEDRSDGLHWSVSLPESRGDLREAIERGDMRAGSWRMKVAAGGDEWRGDVRHIKAISHLLDVSIVSSPAYPSAVTEYRSETTINPGDALEAAMGTEPDTQTAVTPEVTEERAAPVTGGLQVADRVSVGETRSLAEQFRADGFPGETATVDFGEFRAATFTG
ncbi:MAG: HK97 family phage prohead protease, partial [Solirubrobacteraceae bacterium]